jgi:hypothetical protein
MVRLVFWAGLGVALGLAYIHVQLATRDLAIQRSYAQAAWEELMDEKRALSSEVARLRGGDDILDYAREHLKLVHLPADRIEVWKMPRDVVEKYDRVYTEIALARRTDVERARTEPLFGRLLGAVLSPLDRREASAAR